MARWLYRGQLGDYLVEHGWISPSQLEAALREQRQTGQRLGQILLRHGWITRAQLQEALAAQLAVRVWDLRRFPPDPAVARRIPDWVARRYQVLPVADDGRRLLVAMADPTDLEALDQVRLVTGREIEPVLADEDDLKAAVGGIFGLLEVAERALRAARGAGAGAGGPGSGPLGDEPAGAAGVTGGVAFHAGAGAAGGLVAGAVAGPATGGASGGAYGVAPGDTVGGTAGDAAGDATGSAAGTVDGPTAGGVAGGPTGVAPGTAAGSTAGGAAGPAPGAVAGPAPGVGARHAAGVTADPAAGAAAGPAAGSGAASGPAAATSATAAPGGRGAVPTVPAGPAAATPGRRPSGLAVPTTAPSLGPAVPGTAVLAGTAPQPGVMVAGAPAGPGGPVRPEKGGLDRGGVAEAQAPVVEFVQNLLEQAVRQKASDVHLEPGDGTFTIRFRIDGTLHTAMNPPVALHGAVITRLKVMAGMDIAERRLPQDGRFRLFVEGREFDCRCSSMPTVHGEKMVIRLLDKAMGGAQLDALGLPAPMVAQLRELVHRPYGLVLVTGPTGSGKSTTLAALLREVDRSRLNVVTIEDPVEYEIPGASQSQVNLRAGLTFEVALRHFLRQDPDVIMVGEIRDREKADTAVRAALTGHLILSTLHTNDAPSSVTRLVDMGIEPFLLGSSLLAVLAQRLVRVLCPHCRQPYEAGEGVRAVFAAAGIDLPSGAVLYRPGGCPECRGGYAGRRAIAELMVTNPALREAITAGATAAELGRRAVEAGMRTLRQAGLDLALAGETSVEEVLRVTEAPGWEREEPAGRGVAVGVG